MRPESEHGFVLVWVLAVVLAGSSTLLLSTAMHSRASTADSAVRHSLSTARQALIAYAVNYTDLYGPRSAGPGHFPCPDTDARESSGEALLSGPNPPCASSSIRTGRLPSRVIAGRGYYALHQEIDQRLWYAVDAGFINNPTNRLVNSQSKGSIRLPEANDVIAVIVHPAEPTAVPSAQHWQAVFNSSPATGPAMGTAMGAGRVFITMADLRQPLQRRVGAWLVDRFQGLQDHPCTPLPTGERVAGAALLDWLQDRDDALPGAACGEASVMTLEQVPAARHWLVRNQWLSLVSLTTDQRCLGGSETCAVQLSPTASDTVIAGVPGIELERRPQP